MDLLQNIINELPKETVLMGMDVGSKTIGIALSDSAQKIAIPLMTIERKKFSKDLKKLEEIIHDYHVEGYVIGYPLNMDGSEGPKCQSIRDFAQEFSNQLSDELKTKNFWLAFWDERLSTASVEDFVDKTVDISRRRAKEKGIMDKLAAQHILQGALDYIHDHT